MLNVIDARCNHEVYPAGIRLDSAPVVLDMDKVTDNRKNVNGAIYEVC